MVRVVEERERERARDVGLGTLLPHLSCLELLSDRDGVFCSPSLVDGLFTQYAFTNRCLLVCQE